MERLAEDVYLLRGFPRYVFNVYLAGDVLVDAASRYAARRILRQLQGRTVTAHALTHAHPDHQGSSRAVCDALGIPLWCGAADADAVESGRLDAQMPATWLSAVSQRLFAGPACPVARRLREGDRVAGFEVLEVPGHSPGHVAFWRPSDRVLILGDVLNHINVFTGLRGLHEPPVGFTVDPALNRRSARRLAELGPSLICFGHGPPLDDTERFLKFVHNLPEP
jgi:glyoxylase-like metal-dependent hydrolase (beta-lactamase superfamily II)